MRTAAVARAIGCVVGLAALLHGVPAVSAGMLLPPVWQSVADEPPPEQELERLRDALRQHAELGRRALLRGAWLAADDDARDAALAVLTALRDLEAAPGSPPSARAASEAVRVLRGRAPTEIEPLERFADALALALRPGAFEAREEGRGEFTTVRVRALWDAHAPPDEFVVNIYWLGPNGEELRARGEPVRHTALATPGFDMFVRPPVSAPGTWLMVPEVGFDGVRARGVAVTVDCVADLAARLALLDEGALDEAASDPARALLAREVADVALRGIPLLPGASVGAWLEHIEHGAASERPGDVVPRALPGLPTAWELVTEAGTARRALILIDSFSEPARGWFDGPGKRGWLEAARSLEARVLALPAPLDDAAIAALRRELAAGDGAQLLIVARGAAVADVLVRRAALAASVDGLVLETELGGRSAPPPLVLPTLVLDAGSTEDDAQVVERDDRAPLSWVRRRALPIVADLELPELVAAWWRDHEGARARAREAAQDDGSGR